MDSQIVDTQLEYELQDLYRASKHWLSDIAFAEDEARFFHILINKYIKPEIINGQGAKLHHCKMMIFQQQFEVIDLKNNITVYLDLLASLINDLSRNIAMALIERHTLLENRVALLFESARLLKIDLFALAEDVIDNDKNLFI